MTPERFMLALLVLLVAGIYLLELPHRWRRRARVIRRDAAADAVAAVERMHRKHSLPKDARMPTAVGLYKEHLAEAGLKRSDAQARLDIELALEQGKK